MDVDAAALNLPRFLIDELARVNAQHLAGAHLAAVLDAAGLNLQIAAGQQHLLADQLAIGRDGDVARGNQIAVIAHRAQSRLGAAQEDVAGVHAAQFGHVHQVDRRFLRAGQRRGGARIAVGIHLHLGRAGRDVGVLGPQAGIDPDMPRQDVGVVGVAGVHAAAVDAHHAARHAPGFQAALGAEHGLASRQGDAAGIDEAAAIASDARRIGHHHLRTLARHFQRAEQLARIVAAHFVEDDARRSGGQPRIAIDPAAQLGLRGIAAVVEDGAVGIDVELDVVVARDAGRAGGLDIDQRPAVGRGQHGGTLASRRIGVGDDLRVQGRGKQQQTGQPWPDRLRGKKAAVRGAENEKRAHPIS